MCSISKLRIGIILSISLVNKSAPHNSNLGKETCLIGATLDFAERRFTVTSPDSLTDLTYTQAAYALLDASENPFLGPAPACPLDPLERSPTWYPLGF